MDILLVPLFKILMTALKLYQWVIIIHIIMSWLMNFNLINTSNQFVIMLNNILYAATEPVLQRIRRFMPNLSGLDLSPLVLIFALMYISYVLSGLINQFASHRTEDNTFTNITLEKELTAPHIIDGRTLATTLKQELTARIETLQEQHNTRPGLAIIRVGHDPASQVYVASKKRQCEEIGMRSFEHVLRKNAKQQSIIDLIRNMNTDPEIHGMIVQLPLPEGLDKKAILQEIAPHKDVDGLHPLNLGKLFCHINDGFLPCTPKGCLRLIQTVKKDLKGLKAVIIGASNLVGKPLTGLLLQEGCTVSILNSKSKEPQKICQTADILVAAAGSPLLVKENWVKKGVILIDVGINRLVDSQGNTYLAGDVDYEKIQHKAKAITPVPGGVGPMTVACLLENTVIAAERAIKSEKI